MVPYDKSESAIRAFEYAIDLAGKYNANISIVTCISIQIPTDPYFGTAYIETTRLLKEDAVKSTQSLEPKLKELKIQYKIDVFYKVSSVNTSTSLYKQRPFQ